MDLCEKDSESSSALHEAAKAVFEAVIERLTKDDSSSTLVTNGYKQTLMLLVVARGHHGPCIILFENACAELWRGGLAEFWREMVEGDRLERESPGKERLRGDHAVFASAEDGDEFNTYYSIVTSGIPNNPNRSKDIALINAIHLRKEAVVFVLLPASVDSNCRDEAGVPAVHLAIETGSLPIMQLLLDTDARSRSQSTQSRWRIHPPSSSKAWNAQCCRVASL